jgi:hypothetical protein
MPAILRKWTYLPARKGGRANLLYHAFPLSELKVQPNRKRIEGGAPWRLYEALYCGSRAGGAEMTTVGPIPHICSPFFRYRVKYHMCVILP